MTLADYDTNSKLAKGSHPKLKTDGMWKKCRFGGGGGGGGGWAELPAVADYLHLCRYLHFSRFTLQT